jgi:hypothetical protein
MTATFFGDEPSPCPQCGNGSALPIIYGAASDEMFTAAQLGQIVLKDATDAGSSAQWVCGAENCRREY